MTLARPAIDRLLEKTESHDGCLVWTGCLDPMGYGRFHFEGSGRLAHRVAYQLLVGPIPQGLTLDHTCHDPRKCAGGAPCRHRRCVNPEHLEVVTQKENVHRGAINGSRGKTHCPNGHPYDDANTFYRPTPNGTLSPHCRICARARGARHREQQRLDRLDTYAKVKLGAAA